ncbi:methicillin-resistant surface protein [Staphylococcus aureus]|nr:methicillin-resistant surface protein [Staphylococcus aureus]
MPNFPKDGDHPKVTNDQSISKNNKELPDTGEAENNSATLFGITSLFGGLALLFRRKKNKDNSEA